MKRIIVIRHAEAEGNLEHRFIGQSDVALSDEGRRQAGALAARLENKRIDRIVSSDLARSFDTAAPLADRLNIEVMSDPRFREIANGDWTGRLPEEIAALWPDLWTDYVSGGDVTRPNGERWAAVAGRVLAAAGELVDGLPDGATLVVVTHGGPALILARWALSLPIEGNIFRTSLAPLDNASITTIHLPGPRMAVFNDTGHLATNRSTDTVG